MRGSRSTVAGNSGFALAEMIRAFPSRNRRVILIADAAG
jgi:hypothetical protein